MKKIWIGLLTLSLLLIPQIAHADGADFTVATVQNQYQNPTNNGYFALKMPAKAETDLKVTIYNTGTTPETFNLAVNSGVTNLNTALDYAKTPAKGTLSVPQNLQFSQIASLPQKKVTVAPGANTVVRVHLKLPDVSFAGKLLGGITVTRQIETNEKKTTGLTDQFAYAVPIVIRQNDDAVTPKLTATHLKLLTANRNNNLVADIQNVTPTILNGVTPKSELVDQSGRVVFSKIDSNHSIAPQSNFTYRSSLGNQSFASGRYTYRLTVTDNANHTWTWQQPLTLNQSQSDSINNTAKHNTVKKPINWIIIGMIAMAVVIFLLLAAVGYLLFKRSKQKSQTK